MKVWFESRFSITYLHVSKYCCNIILGFIISTLYTFAAFSDCAAEGTLIRVSDLFINQTKNILHADKLPDNYSTLIIDVECSLGGNVLLLPLEAELRIEPNGYIDNGEIMGNNSSLIVGSLDSVIGLNIIISGTWHNSEVYDFWFDFDNSSDFLSNNIIKNILSLSDDLHFCHIYFEADRTYFFELPYKGSANLGDKLPYLMKKGVKKRIYRDLYTDRYSFLRIFTIPSNTHLTIRNHLKMKPTNQGVYFIFWEYEKSNVTVDGKGCISGDGGAHIYNSPFVEGSDYYGEWGHIFCCHVCNNFVFKDITLEYSFGDCIEYSADYSNPNVIHRCSKGLVVEGVKIRYARRNGIAVGANDVLIQNVLFEGCGVNSIKGTAPKAAVDFEPDGIRTWPETGNNNVYLKNCIFKNNKYDVSSTLNNLVGFNKIATHIYDCKFTAPIRLNTTNWIEFKNCVIPDITNYQHKITKKNPVKNLIFRECVIKKMPSILLKKSWKNSFLKCNIYEVEQ